MVFRVAILILDDDLGFAMWLGRVLNEAGLMAFPASRSEEALALIDAPGFPKIDLLIANFELAGSRELLAALAAHGDKFRLIGIGETGAGRRKIHAKLDRPKGKATPSPAPYLKVVRSVL